MKILLAHNRYQLAGGEDAVVAAEHDLLAENGHNVRLFSVTNDAIAGLSAKLRAAARTAGSAWGRDAMAREIAAFRPDIVHVHNFFPLLSPLVYDACRDTGVAVVQTLHNYRTICPGGLLMRRGRPCEECIAGTPYRAALHRCYRGSALGSAAVARMADTSRQSGTWRTKVDRIKNERVYVQLHGVPAILLPGHVTNEQLIEVQGNLLKCRRGPIQARQNPIGD